MRTVLLPIRAQPGSMLIPPFGSLPAVPPAGFRLTDPATGRTLTDPATGLPLTLRAPSGAAVAVTDPETGAVLTDPASGIPLTVLLPGALPPPGPAPDPSQPPAAGQAMGYKSFIAASDISGQRALMFAGAGQVTHADPTQPHYEFAGISTQAATQGSTVEVCELGSVSDPTWTWTPGHAVYPAPNGALTQDVPVAGTLHRIAHAASASEILVQPHSSITLI